MIMIKKNRTIIIYLTILTLLIISFIVSIPNSSSYDMTKYRAIEELRNEYKNEVSIIFTDGIQGDKQYRGWIGISSDCRKAEITILLPKTKNKDTDFNILILLLHELGHYNDWKKNHNCFLKFNQTNEDVANDWANKEYERLTNRKIKVIIQNAKY